jgi:hypothetical protein
MRDPFADKTVAKLARRIGGHARYALFAQGKNLACPTGAKGTIEPVTEFSELSNLGAVSTAVPTTVPNQEIRT